jgi:hypothetical protein
MITLQLVPIFELNKTTVQMSLNKGPLESYLLVCYQTFDFEVKNSILFYSVESCQRNHALTRQ